MIDRISRLKTVHCRWSGARKFEIHSTKRQGKKAPKAINHARNGGEIRQGRNQRGNQSRGDLGRRQPAHAKRNRDQHADGGSHQRAVNEGSAPSCLWVQSFVTKSPDAVDCRDGMIGRTPINSSINAITNKADPARTRNPSKTRWIPATGGRTTPRGCGRRPAAVASKVDMRNAQLAEVSGEAQAELPAPRTSLCL